jgi:hypothetical protein
MGLSLHESSAGRLLRPIQHARLPPWRLRATLRHEVAETAVVPYGVFSTPWTVNLWGRGCLENLFRQTQEFLDKVRVEIHRGKTMDHGVAVGEDAHQEVVLLSGDHPVHDGLLQNAIWREPVQHEAFFLREQSDSGF